MFQASETPALGPREVQAWGLPDPCQVPDYPFRPRHGLETRQVLSKRDWGSRPSSVSPWSWRSHVSTVSLAGPQLGHPHAGTSPPPRCWRSRGTDFFHYISLEHSAFQASVCTGASPCREPERMKHGSGCCAGGGPGSGPAGVPRDAEGQFESTA